MYTNPQMPSTIKIDDKTKIRFDQLQARILLETGKKLNQQELLNLLLQQAEKSEEDLLAEIRQIVHPLTEKDRQKILSLQFDLGVDTAELDEDKIIYEGS